MAENEYEYLYDQVEAELVPNLARFIRIPNQSRNFDPAWETNGLLKQAAVFAANWAAQQGLARFKIELLEEPGRTPTLLAVIGPQPGASRSQNVLIYGHIDKQPPLTEQWHSGKQPYVPVYEKGRLYGRGSGDDGYGWFAAVILIKALQRHQLQRHRYVLFFESDEESDSKDLVYFLKKREGEVGTPDVVLCLDSGTVDDKRFSLTSSTRGVLDVVLSVAVTKHGVHSGDAGGVIPDSFRVIRHLLKSIENSTTGLIPIEEFNPNIPEVHYRAAQELIGALGPDYKFDFPLLPDVQPVSTSVLEQYLNSTWRSQIAMIGIDGVPSNSQAGSVLRPSTALNLSIRMPPSVSAAKAFEALRQRVETTQPLYNAHVAISTKGMGDGFLTEPPSAALARRLDAASSHFFGNSAVYMFEPGSIPFMAEFKARFPKADFVLTGIIAPGSGAHGPNEFADIVYLKKFLCALLFTLR